MGISMDLKRSVNQTIEKWHEWKRFELANGIQDETVTENAPFNHTATTSDLASDSMWADFELAERFGNIFSDYLYSLPTGTLQQLLAIMYIGRDTTESVDRVWRQEVRQPRVHCISQLSCKSLLVEYLEIGLSRLACTHDVSNCDGGGT